MDLFGSRPFTTALAGIVACGLVTVPPPGAAAQPLPRVMQLDYQLVQRAAVTATEIRAAVASTAASTVTPTRAPTPAAATSSSANPVVPLAATSAAIANDVVSTIQTIATDIETTIAAIVFGTIIAAGVAGSLLIAPAWYLSAPITIPLIYANTESISLPPGLFCIGTIYQCYGQPPSPPTPALRNLATAVTFLAGPFILGFLAVETVLNLTNQVGAWLQSVFSGTAAQATAAASTAATETAKPLAAKLAGHVATTVNAVKSPNGAAAPIPQTVSLKQTDLPISLKQTDLTKPLSSATTNDPVVGTPHVPGNEPPADAGVLPTAVTSTKSDLNKAVKQDTGKSRGSLHANGLNLVHREIKPKPA